MDKCTGNRLHKNMENLSKNVRGYTNIFHSVDYRVFRRHSNCLLSCQQQQQLAYSWICVWLYIRDRWWSLMMVSCCRACCRNYESVQLFMYVLQTVFITRG